jgi:predicted flap endonuclease-1-like 5' DNA nuclease
MTLTRDMQRLHGDIEDLREERGATLAGIRRDVLAIHDRTGAFLETSRNELSGAADEGRRERAAFMTKLDKEGEALRVETATFLQEARESLLSAADDGRRERAAFMSRLSSEGESIRAAATTFLQKAHESRTISADEGRHERVAFMSQLTTKGEHARAEWSKQQQAFAVELEGARDAWLGGPAYATEAASQVEIEDHEEVEEDIELEEPLDLEDLTILPGVGTGIRQRLALHGIETLSDLVETTPEQVRQALGSIGRRADVESWIKGARELLEQAEE